MMTFLAPGVDVALGLGGVGEQAGRFDDDVHAQIFPRQGGGAFLDGQALDLLAVDDQRVVLGKAGVGLLANDRPRELALGGVILQQVGEVIGRDEVVDGDHLDLLAQQTLIADRPEDQPTNAAEPINTNTNCHSVAPLKETVPNKKGGLSS